MTNGANNWRPLVKMTNGTSNWLNVTYAINCGLKGCKIYINLYKGSLGFCFAYLASKVAIITFRALKFSFSVMLVGGSPIKHGAFLLESTTVIVKFTTDDCGFVRFLSVAEAFTLNTEPEGF